MKVSGNTISLAPVLAASAISRTVFATPASRSRNGDAACTAAALNFGNVSPVIFLPPFSLSEFRAGRWGRQRCGDVVWIDTGNKIQFRVGLAEDSDGL